MTPYEVVTPRAVQPYIDALQGKRAGYRAAFEQLQRDPCSKELGAYRLSGPLEPRVCGLHLKRGYRLAFTMQPAETKDEPARVVILYVGKREPRHRDSDVWNVVHDLFGVENLPANHVKPPCCGEVDIPDLGDAELDAFLKALRALSRKERPGRKAAMRRSARRSRRDKQ
jgi:hypothetical protein